MLVRIRWLNFGLMIYITLGIHKLYQGFFDRCTQKQYWRCLALSWPRCALSEHSYFTIVLTDTPFYYVVYAVDNDPHFVVRVDGMEEGICFDVNGLPGDIFQLIYDKKNGKLFLGRLCVIRLMFLTSVCLSVNIFVSGL